VHARASVAEKEARVRIVSPLEAASLLRPVDGFAVPLGPGQPLSLLDALGERDDWQDLTVFAALLVGAFRLFTRGGVRLRSGFFGPVERMLRAAGHDVRFVPADFRRFEKIAHELAPRVMATAAAPMDAEGRFSLSLHAGATVEELRRCGRDPGRVLIVEANAQLPRTFGVPPDHPHSLHVSEIDYLLESDRPPIALPDERPGEDERRIAEHVQRYVREGSTLQTGIGGVPNAVVELLSEASGGDYGVHSEMFTTGLMRLHQKGKVTNRKGIYDGYSVATFALGSPELYRWLDGNAEVRFLPVRLVNDPSRIARNRRMVSVNGALSVDLMGQLVADTLGSTQHSGIGGHEDFVAGASLPERGHSLVCLSSTARVGGARISRITTSFPRGTIVTTPRHQVDVVVTEWGAAELLGRSVEERAAALIEIAHPAVRDALRRGEEELPPIPSEPS
jgi:acyl-CoA hydrolase